MSTAWRKKSLQPPFAHYMRWIGKYHMLVNLTPDRKHWVGRARTKPYAVHAYPETVFTTPHYDTPEEVMAHLEGWAALEGANAP